MTMRKILISTVGFFCIVSSSFSFAGDFAVHGYYRTRFEFSQDLDLQRPNKGIVPDDPDNTSNDRFGMIAFGQQRLRLNPHYKFNDHLSLHGQVDLLDNLLFGQSDVTSLSISNPVTGTLSLPPSNGPFGILGSSGGDILNGGGGNINVRRIYADILTSGGKFRIGRQPSQFGLGIFVNDGDGPDGDFGDTFDRILYLAGLDISSATRLNVGFAYDFAYTNTKDPSIYGLDGNVKTNFNDAIQGGMILLLQGQSWELGTFSGFRYRNGKEGATTTTALYVDTEDENGNGSKNDGIIKPAGIDGDTLIFTLDGYGQFKVAEKYRFAFEGVYIGGRLAPGVAVDAVILDDPSQKGLPNPLPNPIVLPQSGTQNDVSVLIGASELDAWWDFGGEAHVQAGYASGDSQPLSQLVTQLGFRPDYDIALLLFDVPLGTSPALRVGGITELGRKPMSPNYVTNAQYVTFGYKQKIDISTVVPWAEDFKLGPKIITAWAPQNNLDINFAEIAGVQGLPRLLNKSRWYGLEIDGSLEATFFDFLHWNSTAGIFFPGGLYDIKNDDVASQSGGIINNIQFDNAEIAYAARTTFTFEF